jgi:SAM-dependent methyltransferase
MYARLWPEIARFAGKLGPDIRVLDVGCGNGFLCGRLAELGCEVVGIDASIRGITIAKETFPSVRFECVNAGGDLLGYLNEKPFDLVVSTEVVEHMYAPRQWAASCFTALKPTGRLVCSTPYHGYLKNTAISLLGKWDSHADPLWDGGHIKLWSRRTLTKLLMDAGFRDLQFRGVGRIRYLWMTMVVSAVKGTARGTPL